jgi:transcriptional regulator with XRE-family HTH domain
VDKRTPTAAGIFSRNLSRARRDAGISQEELGISADVHRTEISQLERGLRVPRLDTIAKLAGSLGAPPERFFEGIEWRPGSIRSGEFVKRDRS